jgi:hypothetical protein
MWHGTVPSGSFQRHEQKRARAAEKRTLEALTQRAEATGTPAVCTAVGISSAPPITTTTNSNTKNNGMHTQSQTPDPKPPPPPAAAVVGGTSGSSGSGFGDELHRDPATVAAELEGEVRGLWALAKINVKLAEAEAVAGKMRDRAVEATVAAAEAAAAVMALNAELG